MPWAALPFIAVFAFILLSRSVTGGFFYFVLAVAGAILAVVYWIRKQLALDLQDGEKTIVQGTVTGKDRTWSAARPGFGSGTIHRSSGSGVMHCFYFGENKVRVDGATYRKYDQGDCIELHTGKRMSSIVFSSKRLDSKP